MKLQTQLPRQLRAQRRLRHRTVQIRSHPPKEHRQMLHQQLVTLNHRMARSPVHRRQARSKRRFRFQAGREGYSPPA